MPPESPYRRLMRQINTPLVRITMVTVIGLIVVSIMWATLPYWHSQTQHMQMVGQWREQVANQVAAFEKEIGCRVILGTHTGGDGMVYMRVEGVPAVEADAIIQRAQEFLRSLEPPRPALLHFSFDDGKSKTIRMEFTEPPAKDLAR